MYIGKMWNWPYAESRTALKANSSQVKLHFIPKYIFLIPLFFSKYLYNKLPLCIRRGVHNHILWSVKSI